MLCTSGWTFVQSRCSDEVFELSLCVLMNTLLVLWQAKRYYKNNEISHPNSEEAQQIGTLSKRRFSTLRRSVRLSNMVLHKAWCLV